jgi:hypothetical protein
VRHLFALLASVAAGVTATVSISGLPFVKFAYRSPSLHLAVELAAAFIALLARQNEFLTWAPLIGGLLATSAFAASAFLPDRTAVSRAAEDVAGTRAVDVEVPR